MNAPQKSDFSPKQTIRFVDLFCGLGGFRIAADEVCETSCKDRGGKYQGQVGVTLPKI